MGVEERGWLLLGFTRNKTSEPKIRVILFFSEKSIKMKKAGKKQIRSLSTKTDDASVKEYKKHVFALKIFFIG